MLVICCLFYFSPCPWDFSFQDYLILITVFSVLLVPVLFFFFYYVTLLCVEFAYVIEFIVYICPDGFFSDFVSYVPDFVPLLPFVVQQLTSLLFLIWSINIQFTILATWLLLTASQANQRVTTGYWSWSQCHDTDSLINKNFDSEPSQPKKTLYC